MNTKFIQEPKTKIAKITPHSTKDRFSSQLPVFFLVFESCAGYVESCIVQAFLLGLFVGGVHGLLERVCGSAESF